MGFGQSPSLGLTPSGPGLEGNTQGIWTARRICLRKGTSFPSLCCLNVPAVFCFYTFKRGNGGKVL